MTTYALILWLSASSYQVVDIELNHDNCNYLEDVFEMETGEDMECVQMYIKT